MHTGKRLTWLAVLLAAAMVALAALAPATALGGGHGKDKDRTFEKNLDAGLVEVINLGAKIYNDQGDHAGCYRVYQGALLAIKPSLSKYPELQKLIDKGIAQANALNRMHERAHALRAVLDEIRYTMTPSLRPAPKSLWDRLGGEAGVAKVVGELMVAASGDPNVNFNRNGKYKFTRDDLARLHKSLVDFVSQATGGPHKYTGPSMKDVHKGMAISDAEFNALAGHLKNVLEKNGVAPDDIKAVLEAIESTRKDIVQTGGKKAANLWDRLGGEDYVTKVVDEFVRTAAKDPEVNFDRGGKFKLDEEALAHVKKAMVTYISSLTGGPYQYSGKELKAAHKGMGITDKEFNATAGHLRKALEKYGAKAADVDEVMKAVAAARASVVEKGKEEAKKDKGPQPDPTRAQIHGVVSFKGEPLNYGFVTFVNPDGKKFSANILKDGTYAFRVGIPPGDYTVMVEDSPTPADPGEKRLSIPAKYRAAETSGLRFSPKLGSNAIDVNLQ
jgi:truncated hemoglobin YjbI